MARPSNATITVDGTKFNSLSTNVGVETEHDHAGTPQMGSLRVSVTATVDVHDTENMPFAALNKLFALANVVTREKLVPIKVEFWQDERQSDAICSYNFTGWISAFHLSGGGESNHTLNLRLTPSLDQQNYSNLKMGN